MVTQHNSGQARAQLEEHPLGDVWRPHRDPLPGVEAFQQRPGHLLGLGQQPVEGPPAPILRRTGLAFHQRLGPAKPQRSVPQYRTYSRLSDLQRSVGRPVRLLEIAHGLILSERSRPRLVAGSHHAKESPRRDAPQKPTRAKGPCLIRIQLQSSRPGESQLPSHQSAPVDRISPRPELRDNESPRPRSRRDLMPRSRLPSVDQEHLSAP